MLRIACLLSLLGSFFLLFGCQSFEVEDVVNVNPARVYQSLTVRYEESPGELSARAQFRFGGSTGTTLRLTGDCKVLFDGKEMGGNERLLQGMVYSTSSRGDFKARSYQFEYLDLDGTTHTNSIAIRSFGQISAPEKLDVNKGITITWTGEGLAENEDVVVRVQGQNNKSASLTVRMTGAKQVTLTPEHLTGLFDGPAELRLTRSTSRSVAEGTEVGGAITGEYEAKPRALTVVGRPAPKTEAQKGDQSGAAQ